MNVLIVEDNAISSKVLEHTLNKHGYETLVAHDGKEAMEYMESHPEIQLVITDLMMPNMNGVELVRKIKDRPEWSEIPILICTSKKPESVNNWIPDQGWKYIFKPIRAESLMQKVKEAFAQQRPVLQDPDQTKSQVGVDSQAFLEMIDELSKIAKEKIDLLEQHVRKESGEALVLDDLLEGARLVRADRVLHILNRLEQGAAAKPEMIRSLYPVLLRELKAMRHYLTIYAS